MHYAVTDAVANSAKITTIQGSRAAVVALNGLRVAGKTLMIVGIANDLYEVHTSGYQKRVIITKSAGWVGAGVGSAMAGAWAAGTGMDFAGPWGWCVHGIITSGGGVLGYFYGQEVAEEIYQNVVELGCTKD